MKKRILLVMLFLFLAGCENKEPYTETTMETVSQAASVPETQPVELAETEGAPAWQEMESYQWMVNLQAEDVEFIEFVFLSDPVTPYRRYAGEEIQEIIDLFQNNLCHDYTSLVSWQGDFTQEFHIVMKDGTAHRVCSIGTVTTVIDGAAFDTISAWIMEWPETGNAPLPENWEQEVSSRNYVTVEEECSFLGTDTYHQSRESLDAQYDSDVLFGSDSRNYPIGRGGVTLYAEEPSPTGVSLKAYWTGSYGGRQVSVQPEYALERWDESYHPVETDAQLLGASRTMTAQDYVHWYISWEAVYGYLQPGYYRIGMTFAEELNGSRENETICYAKFCVE